MASKFVPTQGELSLAAAIFAQFDQQKLGALTGEVAVRAFSGANLPPSVLGEVWSVADEANNGWLSQKGVAIALRLIGWAQKGEKVSKDLLDRCRLSSFLFVGHCTERCLHAAGPLPTIAGVTPVVQHNTGASSVSSNPSSIARAPSGVGSLPPVNPADKAKFYNMFVKAGPVDGLVSGEKAQQVFIKSKLSNEILGQIW